MLPRRLAVVLFAAFSVASTARADNVADEADLRFRRGTELYARGRIDEALSEFFVSNRLAPNRNVVFNIASCFERLGRREEAYRYFNDLLADETNPDEIAALEQGIARLRPRVALVQVESVPPGADIFVERVDLGSQGRAPRTLALSAGPTRVIARLEGYYDAEVDVTLSNGREVPVRLELERIYGFVDATSVPTGALARAVADDGESCRTPCSLRVVPGRQTIEFVSDEYVTLRRDVEVAANTRSVVEGTLERKPPPLGKLVVQANKTPALVRIDGVEAGFTPVVVDVPIGRHKVEVSYPEYETWTREVTVTEDSSSIVDARLNVPPPAVSAAAKSLGSSNDTAASVTVISAEEIRAMGWQTLAQALRAVRGLYLSNDRTYDYVGVRGFQPPGDFNTRILVLVDGHPYNDVWVGQAGIGTDFDIDLSQVERIEVVRGPNSALYGSAAVFGVINVVHRLAPRQGLVELRATGGNHGTMKGRVTAGYEGEGWGLSVSGAGLQTDNAPSTQLDLPEGTRTIDGLDGASARHFQALARYKGLHLVAVHNDRSKELPTAPFGTLPNTPGTRARDDRTFVEGRFEHGFDSGLELTARGYWDQVGFKGTYKYEDGTSVDEDRADWAGGELRLRTPSLRGHRLGAGLEAQRWIGVRQFVQKGNAPPSLDDNHSATVMSAYVADDWRISERFKAEFAVRADKYIGAIDDFTFAPRAALLGKLYEGGLTKLAVGRAFRIPSIYERYYQDGVSQVVAGALNPEVIIQGEIEHTHRLNEELLLTSGVFASELSELIGLETRTDDKLVYANTQTPIRVVGAEFDLRWQPSRLQLLSFAYSFQYSTDPTASDGRALTNSPRHMAALRGMHPLMRSLALGFELIWNSARLGRDGKAYGEALVASVALSGDIDSLGLHYALSAQNLFDEKYELPVGDDINASAVAQYGRTLQLTLSKSFF